MARQKNTESAVLFPQLWSDFFENDQFFNHQWPGLKTFSPAVNIKETKKDFQVELSVPGFQKDDFKIEVDENTLLISGQKEDEKTTEKERFTRKEFSHRSFSRAFTLPQNVSEANIEASCKNGILKLTVPKKAATEIPSKREIKIA